MNVKTITIGLDFIRGIFQKKFLIMEMAKRDFQKTYISSYLGMAWAFLQPLIMYSVIWFVFAIGLKGGNRKLGGLPFIVYFFSGMITYSFLQGMVSTGVGSVKEYSFLVRKVDFRLSILPIVKIISAFWLHLVFLMILFVISINGGYYPNWYWLQIIYYSFAAMLFALGLSWIVSSIQPFIPDVQKIVAIFLQMGFWMTPIIWDIGIVPPKYQIILKLNPAYYIVNGYRDSLFLKKGFWEHPLLMVYFWSVTLILLFIGMKVYTKLKLHFAEVV